MHADLGKLGLANPNVWYMARLLLPSLSSTGKKRDKAEMHMQLLAFLHANVVLYNE